MPRGARPGRQRGLLLVSGDHWLAWPAAGGDGGIPSLADGDDRVQMAQERGGEHGVGLPGGELVVLAGGQVDGDHPLFGMTCRRTAASNRRTPSLLTRLRSPPAARARATVSAACQVVDLNGWRAASRTAGQAHSSRSRICCTCAVCSATSQARRMPRCRSPPGCPTPGAGSHCGGCCVPGCACRSRCRRPHPPPRPSASQRRSAPSSAADPGWPGRAAPSASRRRRYWVLRPSRGSFSSRSLAGTQMRITRWPSHLTTPRSTAETSNTTSADATCCRLGCDEVPVRHGSSYRSLSCPELRRGSVRHCCCML